ncbi:MAG: hypothetical protein JW910_19035 [Anaerolineae bacterium]|nr:hypothetical protein [Anaerolineae bacterium]
MQLRQRYAGWWRQDALVLHILAPRDNTETAWVNPQAPFYHLMSGLDPTVTDVPLDAIEAAWLEALPRARAADRYMANIFFGGDAFPYFDTQTGPGNLAAFLGSEPQFSADTVWHAPCIDDLEAHPALVFSPANPWFQKQKAVVEAGVAVAAGRYPVGMPDLTENMDVLASLRGTEDLLIDMIERPAVVEARLAEVNRACCDAFAALYEIVESPWGGNVFSAFAIWGQGKITKLQCDASVMISGAMFERFVVPGLTEMCAWFDHAMYHLDGTQAVRHLDRLLAIDALGAIEWTPQVGVPQGGSAEWYPLYRKILAAGKSVQAVNVLPDEVIPLLNAIGTHGVFLMVNADSEADARALAERVEVYR